MIISKEALVDLQEKYEKVNKLIEEDSKLDPENEPFLSKYAARNILISMNANIENLLRQTGPDSTDRVKLIGMIGVVQLLLGIVSIDTEELTTGDKHLTKCKELIQDYESKPEVAYVTLNMHNQLGILWAKLDPDIAQQHLERAEKFYFEFKASEEVPIDPHDLFTNNIEIYNETIAIEKFEKLYTLSLYYLAQIHAALGSALRSSVYCHITLKRQLESKDYEPIDWALNCATLSQFFMEKHGFKQARHHLSASSHILDIYEEELNAVENQETEEFQAKLETLKHRSADIARCWSKYGLMLLTSSKDRLLRHTDDIDSVCDSVTDLSNLILDENSKLTQDDIKNLYFPTLNLHEYEEKITDKYLLTFEDAKKVFTNVLTWLTKAHSYYRIDSLASDYIEIAQDQSMLYDSLVFYEDEPDNQAKLYKRSADILETVVKQVNPTYYMQYCKQIWFRLGQIYSDMADIKASKLNETRSRPNPHALYKLNCLTEKSMENFQSFIDSFKNPMNEMPKTIEEDMQKAFLQAYFHIGVLYSRLITLDKGRVLENTKGSLAAYKKIDEYCKENPKAAEMIQLEFGVITEMLQLLPMKIIKLQHEAQQAI